MRGAVNRLISRKKCNYERAKLRALKNHKYPNEVRIYFKKLNEQVKGFKASNTSICYSQSGSLITKGNPSYKATQA